MQTKICPNPTCRKTFEAKNPKKRYCNSLCKNKASYTYRQEVYEWEYLNWKARLKNIKILEHLISLDIFMISRKELVAMGFDFSSAYIPDQDFNKQAVYRFGNIYLVLITETEFKLELINIKKYGNQN